MGHLGGIWLSGRAGRIGHRKPLRSDDRRSSAAAAARKASRRNEIEKSWGTPSYKVCGEKLRRLPAQPGVVAVRFLGREYQFLTAARRGFLLVAAILVRRID